MVPSGSATHVGVVVFQLHLYVSTGVGGAFPHVDSHAAAGTQPGALFSQAVHFPLVLSHFERAMIEHSWSHAAFT